MKLIKILVNWWDTYILYLISSYGIWEIFCHSEPFSSLQFSDRSGHPPKIHNCFNLERLCMAVELGRHLRFLQCQVQRYRREEGLPNQSGKTSSNSSPMKNLTYKYLRAVRCWSWWGALFSVYPIHVYLGFQGTHSSVGLSLKLLQYHGIKKTRFQ